MVEFQDFLLDVNGDLQIQNGDFVVGPSNNQHVADIIQSFVGSWKQNPILGVGMLQYLKSQNAQVAVNSIKNQLQSDGFSVSAVNVKNGGRQNTARRDRAKSPAAPASPARP